MSIESFDILKLLHDKSWAVRLCWVDDPMLLPKEKGLYVLHLFLDQDKEIKVGAQGSKQFLAGHYFYVGSAKSAGGLMRRVGHHWRESEDKPRHWHIDYLRQHMALNGCWLVADMNLGECELANAFKDSGFDNSLKLGSSDCGCDSHLFYRELSLS